jgi:prepilin peptidase CpaA
LGGEVTTVTDPPSAIGVTKALALVLVLVCAAFDWRSRRIPNVLTLTAIALGLALNALFAGAAGAVFSAFGLAIGAGLLLIPYLMGGMGAGDVKLMGAVGALLGWQLALTALLYTALAGGLIAVAAILRTSTFRSSFSRIGSMFRILLASKRVPTADSLGGESVKIPYAVAIAVGTLAALLTGWPA